MWCTSCLLRLSIPFFFLMIRRPPRPTRTATPVPFTTLCRSLVIFAIAFCDAVTVVGAIVPALPLLFAIGVLIGLGELYGPYAVACAALGAFIGDGLSFWTGRRWGSQLRGVWPFARYPQLLDSSEAVFRRNARQGIVYERYQSEEA